MRERPILFNGAMVRAILAGQKTQTRRAVKPAPQTIVNWKTAPWEGDGAALMTMLLAQQRGCPFGQPGDRLWVRETTRVDRTTSDSAELARYSADQEPVCYPVGTGSGYDGAWQLWWYDRDICPSIHMPRKACRLLLEITAVRVEPLQAISAQDCIAEGMTTRFTVDDGNDDLRTQFRDLWTSTGGDWDSNPWVWVIEFNRINEVSNG